MNSHAKWLRQAAEEIANEGHVGWGNTCTAAAEEIERLTAEVTRLTTIATSARCLIMAGDDESKDIDWFKHYDELSALLGIRDSGSHKNDCFCAGICDPTDIRCVKRSGATDSGSPDPVFERAGIDEGKFRDATDDSNQDPK